MVSVPEDMAMVARLDKLPSMVVYMGKIDHTTLLNNMGPNHGLLVEYIPGYSHITVTCHGLVRRAVLTNLSLSLGQVEDMCSMRNKEIRIAHNNVPPMFAVNNNEVDSDTLEGAVLDTFLEKYSLRPTFINAKQVWGIKNETSGLWDGVIGLVRFYFQNFPNFGSFVFQVGYNSSDLGVTSLFYIQDDRTRIIEFTDPVLGRLTNYLGSK